jgi:hypothetical protein
MAREKGTKIKNSKIEPLYLLFSFASCILSLFYKDVYGIILLVCLPPLPKII